MKLPLYALLMMRNAIHVLNGNIGYINTDAIGSWRLVNGLY